MNKLIEKFIKLKDEDKLFIHNLEQITDDFAVKFAEWYIDNYHLNKTTSELLEIFKNNHYE